MTTPLPNVGQYFYQTLDNNFVSRLEIPENNFYLLRVNIRHDYQKIAGVRMVLGNTGFKVIGHHTKPLSHNRLHHSGIRVFEINMKTKIFMDSKRGQHTVHSK